MGERAQAVGLAGVFGDYQRETGEGSSRIGQYQSRRCALQPAPLLPASRHRYRGQGIQIQMFQLLLPGSKGPAV